METLSARYQDAVDRYVRGDDVPRATLRHAWEDHTVANSTGLQAEEMIEAVRTLNRATPNHRLRVVAGDPPIDWENITSVEDHRRWIDLRDSYPADVIRHQVLERGRKALVVYGQGHLQRRQIASNYDMSLWQEQTVVSLLERDAATHLFNVWTLLDAKVGLPAEVQRWRIPSLALLRGTSFGARDFGEFSRGLRGQGIRRKTPDPSRARGAACRTCEFQEGVRRRISTSWPLTTNTSEPETATSRAGIAVLNDPLMVGVAGVARFTT